VPENRISESTQSSDVVCWNLEVVLCSTNAEGIKSVVYILLSVDVPVLPYCILL